MCIAISLLVTHWASAGIVISGGGLALVEEGGVIKADNLACGKVAFAQNEIGIAPHAISKVNDGLYGNANSWIAGAEPSFDTPVAARSQQLNANRKVYKGGTWKLTVAFKGFEFTSEQAALAQDPDVQNAIRSECGCACRT